VCLVPSFKPGCSRLLLKVDWLWSFPTELLLFCKLRVSITIFYFLSSLYHFRFRFYFLREFSRGREKEREVKERVNEGDNKVIFVCCVCESPPWYRVMIYILHTPNSFHTDPKLSSYAHSGIVCPLKTKKLGFDTWWWMIMIMTQKPYQRKRERDGLECPWESFFFLPICISKVAHGTCQWNYS